MKIQLRNMLFSRSAARDVSHVALIPEVQHALLQWIKSKTEDLPPGVLIGGLAMSFYAPPRATQDVDLLFLAAEDIPKEVIGFRHHRAGAFQENKTHVEVEVTHAAAIHIPYPLAWKVYQTAVVHDGLRVASAEGMVALKLYGSDTPKREFKDLGDVVAILEGHPNLDMSGWGLKTSHEKKLEDCRRRAAGD